MKIEQLNILLELLNEFYYEVDSTDYFRVEDTIELVSEIIKEEEKYNDDTNWGCDMYIRIDTNGNPWDGTARYKKVKTPNAVKKAMKELQGLELNKVIEEHGGDVLATRRPDLICKSWIVKS